jgi:hypothetical protein
MHIPQKEAPLFSRQTEIPCFVPVVRRASCVGIASLLRLSSIQVEDVRDRAFSGGSAFRDDGIDGSLCCVCCGRPRER